ncbi:MAG: phospholipase D family protein [Sphingobacteriaceae bacterium]|nr:phospholipase D family protein [Sphingobacteriaceae bacterium]
MNFKLLIILSLSAGLAFASTPINSGASFDIGFSPDQGSLPLVLKGINSAHKSIHVAAYSFTSKPIAEALLAASKRGVDVKVVADEKSNSGKYSATTYLANNKVPVKLDGNYPIFHHKFMVIDGVNLETGSFNYSAAAATKNAENVLILWNVPTIAATYDKEWTSLWNEAQLLSASY